MRMCVRGWLWLCWLLWLWVDSWTGGDMATMSDINASNETKPKRESASGEGKA